MKNQNYKSNRRLLFLILFSFQTRCRTEFTWWHETVGRTLEYLDNFDIHCRHGEFLRQWRMTWGERERKKAVRFVCCHFVLPSHVSSNSDFTRRWLTAVSHRWILSLAQSCISLRLLIGLKCAQRNEFPNVAQRQLIYVQKRQNVLGLEKGLNCKTVHKA